MRWWEAARVGRTDNIGARADLDLITEIMGLVVVLDGINRVWFGSDSDEFAAWTAGKHIPVGGGEEVPVPGTGMALSE